MKVAEKRNWGPIALFSATGLLVVGIIAYGAWPSISGAFEPSWRDRAAGIHHAQKQLAAPEPVPGNQGRDPSPLTLQGFSQTPGSRRRRRHPSGPGRAEGTKGAGWPRPRLSHA